jgi:hypothetical protein
MSSTFRYALDTTGKNPDNLVIGEVQTLSTRALRVVTPTYGPFFAAGLVVYDNATDKQLTPGVQYTVNELLDDATEHYGQGIYRVIIIKDAKVSNKVRINYQALGGNYQNNFAAIASLYEAIINDNRSVDWANVMDKDVTYPPTMHNHLIEDCYGFEPLVAAIEQLRKAMILSDVPAFESMNMALKAHIENTDNPHHDTAAQVGAYTREEVDQLFANVQQNIGVLLQNHISDHNNPHQVTADQIPTYTTSQLDQMFTGINNTLSKLNFSELVNGTATAYLDPNGYLLSSGDVGAFSDIRLKKNIRPIRKAIETLKQIGGWKYDWRSGFCITKRRANQHDFGVIADQLQKVLPEAVGVVHSEKDGDDFLVVYYTKLIPFLIAAAVDQDKETQKLKEKLNQQSREIRTLKRQMARLLKKVG